MKKNKTNNRSAISKITARVMLVVLLLTSALSFSACGKGADKYVIVRRYDTQWYTPIEILVSSNTKTFSKDNVTLNLSYALHLMQSNGEPNTQYYYDTCIGEYDLIYGLYIADDSNYKDAGPSYCWFTNSVEDIYGYQFIKQISETEALTNDYLAISPWFAYGYGFETFNHTEKITIPQEYVSNRMGYFDIIITVFGKTDNSYVALDSVRVACFYKELDENTIEIDMEDWDYFRIKKPLFE